MLHPSYSRLGSISLHPCQRSTFKILYRTYSFLSVCASLSYRTRFLLGSGGTLMFDLTILSQFFVYRTRRYGRSYTDDGLASEETGLLISAQQHYHIGDHSSRGRTLVKATEQ